MPQQNFQIKRANTTLFRHFPRATGVLLILLGLSITVSWYADWRWVLQLVPNTAPMQFNTALSFIGMGIALVLLTTRWKKYAPWVAGGIVIMTALTLLEYCTGQDFSIDQLFFKPQFETMTAFAGRMSPLTAVCFMLSGASIITLGYKSSWRQRLTLAGMFACIVAVVGFVALFGFVFGIESAYGWGSYSAMAVNTAGAFLCLGTALVVRAWQTATDEDFNFLRWLPVTGALTLLAMIAFVSAINMEELKNATFWRKHTIDVILDTAAFDDNLLDMQRGLRGYVAQGDTNALAAFYISQKLEPQLFDQLVEMTADNPSQTKRLKAVATAVNEILAYDDRLLKLYNEQGFQAVSKNDATGEGQRAFGHARDDSKTFRQEEQKLLDRRDLTEQADNHNASRLLVMGSVMTALLLVLANKMASRELKYRQRVELRLREVSTMNNAILTSADYAIIALDPGGTVTSFNSAAERMLGYAAEEVVGKLTPMAWREPAELEEQARKLSQKLGRSIQPGIEVITSRSAHAHADEYEATYIHKNGRRFPVLVSLTSLTDQTGRLAGYLGVIADITERKRAQEKVRESEERFRRAFDDAPIGMGLVSPEGRWLKVNVALSAMLGYSEAELLVTDFQRITHPDDLQKDLELLKQVLNGAIPSYQIEKRYFHHNGEVVSVMLSVSLVRDANSKPLYFVSQIENITERKTREVERERLIKELQEALAQVRTLSGMIPICGWCKSVRSDQGYWQSVEQYVRANTAATFSHGICPACMEKMKTDIAASNPKSN
jgi:PAS domain S-box-containing protein